jgi:hypothetical protein
VLTLPKQAIYLRKLPATPGVSRSSRAPPRSTRLRRHRPRRAVTLSCGNSALREAVRDGLLTQPGRRGHIRVSRRIAACYLRLKVMWGGPLMYRGQYLNTYTGGPDQSLRRVVARADSRVQRLLMELDTGERREMLPVGSDLAVGLTFFAALLPWAICPVSLDGLGGESWVLSAERVLPSGLNATEYTKSLSVVSGLPICLWVATFHKRTVPSALPLARVLPSGLNPTEKT